MAVFYPDITGEYMLAPERFETGGLQFAGYFEPKQIAPEQVANLYLFLQNTFDVPIAVMVQLTMPLVGGGLFKSGKPVLCVDKPAFKFKMAEVEAGLLTIPVTTTPDVQPGEFELTLEFKIVSKNQGNRVRPQKSTSKLGAKSLIDNPVGLNLVGAIGATFVEKTVKNASFSLKIAGKPQPPDRAPKLAHEYQAIWTRDQIEIFNQVVHELNLRQVKLKAEITSEALYATLYAETVARFADAGLPLRIGEAVILAKILTYTCQYFLGNTDRYNGLMVPIWQRALESGADTTDALHVMRTVGYYHILRLSIAISFGVIARSIGRHVWSAEEREGVNNHISESIEVGQTLDEEFLYLPLLMAGTAISNKLTLEGEDPSHTLALMRKAYEARTDLFLEDDMAQASQVYHQIWKKIKA